MVMLSSPRVMQRPHSAGPYQCVYCTAGTLPLFLSSSRLASQVTQAVQLLFET
jgi:hypothetical protein